jgi:hypothetical protein
MTRPFIAFAASLLLACSPPVTQAAGNDASAADASDGSSDGASVDSRDASSEANAADSTDAPDGSGMCENDQDCADALFCNGVERCRPTDTGADARGCIAAPTGSPCTASQMCDETDDMCTEACRDSDADGARDARCGGTDCDDARASVHPGAAEVCDGLDNDCNFLVDDGVTNTFYVDNDHDGFGDASAAPMMACAPPAGYVTSNTDCDDANAAVHPGAPEMCDAAMVDENCDGTANPPSRCACTSGASRPCPEPGACAAGTQVCISGAWSACSIAPVAESCNGVDDDCDGIVDDGLTVQCYADNDNDTYAPAGSTANSVCPAFGRDTVGGCPIGTTNRAPGAASATDCDDLIPTTHPGATDVPNGRDDDCNGTIDG